MSVYSRRDGLLGPAGRIERQRMIQGLADQIDALAQHAAEGQATTYRLFNVILSELTGSVTHRRHPHLFRRLLVAM